MLALGLHSQPGVYALLLGSGVSTGAGIPTGWGVVQELVRRAAVAHDPEDSDAIDQARADPAAWWVENGDGEPLGYSNLLAALAPTPAARRGLLAGFFEPSEEDLEVGNKVPSDAHRAIAQLVKSGHVRVIVTTNFDRLMERALEEEGVPPQVASTPAEVTGLTPLAHSPATVLKVHGDYADLVMRNTVEELDSYPSEWDEVLDRVFDDYGLIVCGWSAEWDRALVSAIKRSPHRRYPMYWDSRSGKGSIARQVLVQRGGVVVPASSADSLFADLHSRVDALDRLKETPLTTALSVARLKRYIADPRHRINAHDLLILDPPTRWVDRVVKGPCRRS